MVIGSSSGRSGGRVYSPCDEATDVVVGCNWRGKSGKYGLNKTILEKIVCGMLSILSVSFCINMGVCCSIVEYKVWIILI